MIQCDDCLVALQWLYIIIWTESSDKTINNILCEVRLLTNDGWRIYEEWRVNDVCYYYFNPTELNPCTLYKVLEFVTVEGNFNLVGGDKGIRNTIMAWWEVRGGRYSDYKDINWTWPCHDLDQSIRGSGKHYSLPSCHPALPIVGLFVYLSSALGERGTEAPHRSWNL